MGYKVRLANGASPPGLGGGTACVYWTATLQALVPNLVYGQIIDLNTFGFWGTNSFIRTLVLSAAESLNNAPVGATVLIDDGLGKWRLGTVLSDGSSTTVNGTVLPPSTPAASLISDNNQQLPPYGEYTQVGVASTGKVWFNNSTYGMVVCNAMSTVGSLGSGVAAMVQEGSNFFPVQL